MIQRVQSIFLLLVAIAMLSVTYFPIWIQVDPEQTRNMTMDAWSIEVYDISTGAILDQTGNIYVGILAIIAAGIALYSFSQYKNRTRQMFLNMINSLVMGITLGVIVFVTYQANLEFNPDVSGAFVIGFYAIAFAIIMNIISNRFIRKDEMLVRSVDRIR